MPSPPLHKDWCVITGAVGDHMEFTKWTVPTMRRYAEVMDMDFAQYELWPTDPPLGSSWEKVMLMRHKLEVGYEGVLWVDADAMFVRYDEDIRDVVEPGWNWVHNKYAGKPWPCVPCTGVVAVTAEAMDTLHILWELREEYINAPWVEQTAAHVLFGWDPTTGELHEPEGQSALPDRWNSTPESPAEDPVIYHAASHDGSTLASRCYLLQEEYVHHFPVQG